MGTHRLLALFLLLGGAATCGGDTFDGLVVPMLVAAVPALLILRQPDLGSSLVFAPVLLAMCYAAGAPARSIVLVVVVGLAVAVLAYLTENCCSLGAACDPACAPNNKIERKRKSA